MKSEERHQLQQNELKKLGHHVQDLMKADFWDKYQNHILIAISVVCLGLAAWIYFSRRSLAGEMAAWRDMSGAVPDYSSVVDNFPNSSAAPWAALKESERKLSEGSSKMFTDRKAAATDLDAAKTKLDELVKSSDVRIRERALLLLGQTLETQSQLEEATKQYELLLKDFPETPYKDLVNERLLALKSGAAKDFYTWFAAQKPKPVEAPKPRDEGAESLLPSLDHGGFDLNKPLSAPSNSSGKTPAEKTTEEKTTPEEKPEALKAPVKTEEKPAGETPAEKTEAPKAETPKTEGPKLPVPEKTEEPKAEETKPKE